MLLGRIALVQASSLLAVSVAFLAGAAQAGPPHVLLIVTDDQGWMDLHCQGNERLHTPRIDALARQGVRFTSAYAAAPVCSPSRAALITGLAPARLHITQHGQDGPAFWPQNRKVQPPAAEHVLPLQAVTIADTRPARPATPQDSSANGTCRAKAMPAIPRRAGRISGPSIRGLT